VQRVVAEFKPDYTVEFGTQFGGMTLALHDCWKQGLVVTFDCERRYVSEVSLLIAGGSVKFYCEDILSGESKWAVRYLWDGDYKKLLYCDNGNKVKEVLIYGKYLSTGDMLGVHDWGVEIHTEPARVGSNWRGINDSVDFTNLRQLLEKFELVGEGKQTRLWIKK
jgi:cephalosporin hydroxylase